MTPAGHRAPAELFRHSLDLLLDKKIPEWTDLWAPEGSMEFPFAPQGWPRRLDGKAAIGEYMRAYPEHIDLHEIPHLQIHQTVDPATIVVEMRAVGRLVETGEPYDMSYIAVITAQDGRFTSYRDYWNPLALQQPGADFTKHPAGTDQ